MAPLKLLSLVVISGIGLNQVNYSLDEKFTLLKYQGFEINQPTFDSLLTNQNPFITGTMKMGLDSLYHSWPETLNMFLPKDSFLMDLAFQYSSSFFILFMHNKDILSKLDEAIFLKSLGFSFSTTDLEKVTDKEIKDLKNRAIHSFIPNITDAQLQRFYGTITTEGCSVEGLNDNDSSELFQTRINSLNKGDKIYKIHINKQQGQALKLKEHFYHSANLMPFLNASVGQYILLETAGRGYRNRDIYRIKKIDLAPISQIQKNREAMKAKLQEIIGQPLYEFKKTAFPPTLSLPTYTFGIKRNPEATSTKITKTSGTGTLNDVSSDLPIIKLQIQRHKMVSELIEKFFTGQNIDPMIPIFTKELIKSCNEQYRIVTSEEIKKDRNVLRLFVLANIFLNELSSPILSNIDRIGDVMTLERIRILEVLKEVQHPASIHLLLAQLYHQTKNPKASEEIESYLKKDGLSHSSYLPLTNKLIEDRSQKVQGLLDSLKDPSPEKAKDLKDLLEKSKSSALQKVKA